MGGALNAESGLLGRVFALADAEEQAAFLNVAGRTLRTVCRVHDGREDMQIMRIVDRLDPDGKRFVRELAEWIRHDAEMPR